MPFKIALLALAMTATGETSPAAIPPPATMESGQPPVTAPAAGAVHVAAGTELTVELGDTLTSKTNHVRDTFALRLLEPIKSGDAVIVQAGAMGAGEVIDASPSGIGGKPGKLIVSARYLDLNGQRVRIRGLKLVAAGDSRVDFVTGTALIPYVGIVTGFIQGGELELPAGTRATVQLIEAVDLPAAPSAVPAEVKQDAPKLTEGGNS